jgi:hypothetical protein
MQAPQSVRAMARRGDTLALTVAWLARAGPRSGTRAASRYRSETSFPSRC